MTTATTDTGVVEATGMMGITDATDAFLSRLLPKEEDAPKEPSEKKTEDKDTKESEQKPTEEAETETGEETPPETEEAETDGEAEDNEPPAKKYVDDDEVYVKIKVDGEELEVPVKDLKRLHGQEASLTRKGQELAEQRKQVDARAQQYAAGLDALVKRAEARANEFRKINFLALTKDPTVNAEQLGILQDEARKAFEEEQFLKGELGNFVQAVSQEQQATRAAQAQETVKTLGNKDSPMYIEGWGQKVYDEIRSFAKSEGLSADIVDNIVDAPAIKLLHMAMMYKRGAAKVATKVVNKTPKKIVKTSNTPATPNSATAKQRDAMKTHRNKGTVDSATDAFLAGWANNQSD